MPAQSDLTEDEWAIIARLLPAERGRNCRPAHDNRRVLNGMLWVAHTGAPWRDLPAEYGKWNSVYQRFRRWGHMGLCDAVAEALGRVARRDGARRAANSARIYVLHPATALKALSRRGKRPSNGVVIARSASARAQAC